MITTKNFKIISFPFYLSFILSTSILCLPANVLIKKQRWKEMEEKIDKITPKIDEGIKETVIILNLLGFETTGSCQGHFNDGFEYPYIDFR